MTSLARELQTHCRGTLRLNEPLSKHTTFGVGGPADLFFLPADLDDLALAVPLIRDAGLPVLPLGGGTNTLAGDAGFRGLIICLNDGAKNSVFHQNEGVVQAGTSTQVFSRRCQRNGKTGFEFGCGIPGTIGGAIYGNAGAWGGETFTPLMWLRGIDLTSGNEVYLKKTDITFGYRHTALPEHMLIVEAGFQLEDGDPEIILSDMDRMLSERKASQPLSNRSSGCMFKNPPGTSAGLLIDKAGCKGLTVGAVEVSQVHANFIVNTGGDSAEDVLKLIDQVRQRVLQSHNIALETEVKVIGEYGIEVH